MYRIRKLFRFEAAHQLDRALSKACTDSIHGHSYVVEIFLTSKCLNGDQMVLDFGALAPIIEAFKEEWDHALILSTKLAREYQGTPSKKIVTLGANPTAEVMAFLLHKALTAGMASLDAQNGLRLEKVRVHETVTGWAEYQGGQSEDQDLSH